MPTDGENYPGSLRFFYCGQGDTILVCSGTRNWGLIDCHLTRESLAKARLEAVLDTHQVAQLQFVCLTHPHQDHYHGMCGLLEERFKLKSRLPRACDVRQFWDTGVLGVVWPLMRRGRETHFAEELEDLMWLLVPQIHRDTITYRLLQGDESACYSFGEFTIRCLAPGANRLERYRHHEFEEIRDSSSEEFKVLKEEVNNLSAVLVFIHNKTGAAILLGADATVKTWKEALDVWKSATNGEGRFRGVKVSHHGARANLYPSLYGKWCDPGKTVAIMSVGPDDPNHPHEDVRKLFDKCRIQPYYTCRPLGGRRRGRSDLLLGGRVPLLEEDKASFPRVSGHIVADLEVQIDEEGRSVVTEHRP